MDTIRLCRQCRAPLPAEWAGGLCPECESTPDRAPPAGVSPTPPPPPPTPSELAQFFPALEILELIGQGGMGMVYKARQRQLDRLVALKVLSPELGRDAAFAARFSREAQALARLHHSNIVSVFDFGRAGDYFYFLMEYVDGVTLRRLIDKKQLQPGEAQRIVVEICQALQFAHEEGIVHRDIKPSNILIDKKGRVKVADFGLAKLAGNGASEPAGHVQTAPLWGTPPYMAPEQLEKPAHADHRADIYALGVVFYEMLTGGLPMGRVEPPSKVAGVDARLDEVVLRAMDKEPDRRYQQAGDMRAAVEKATGRFSSLAGDMPPARRRHGMWRYLAWFGLMAGTAVMADLFYLTIKDHWPEPMAGRIPPGAMEAFAASPEGAGVGRRMAAELRLNKDQLQNVNKSVRRFQREFASLERRHTTRRKDAAGHVHITIEPFPDAMNELMSRMWADLGTVLGADQLATARALHFEKLFPHTGQSTVNVEIWWENGDYHYVESQENAGKPGATNSAGGPALPPRYRSYLRDSR